MALRVLQKWHGAGNDFLVEIVEQGAAPWWSPETVRGLCDRHTGVGADGLLVASLGPAVTMHLLNADGSTAVMSGNGIRCLVAAVRRATGATWDHLDVETDAGLRTVDYEGDEDAGWGSVDMGVVTRAPAPEGSLGLADVGNPHVVVRDHEEWTDEWREHLAREFSVAVGGANVEFVRVVSRHRVVLSVIERGVGWTRACGTGSCAVAAVLRELGEVDDDVTIVNPGGELLVHLDGARATLSGPVQFVANVEWLDE